MSSSAHVPVMAGEVVEYLRPERGGVYFDGTVGYGGHAEAILAAGADARIIGVDRDSEALAACRTRLERFAGRYLLIQANYAAAAAELSEPLAGALLDLGISSRQVDDRTRGFTFAEGAPLDMRMSAGDAGRTAAEVLNESTQSELADIFYHFGEERRARRLASEIVRRRAVQPFRTSDDLVAAMRRALGRLTVKDKARIFQAVRIAVNDELRSLESALPVVREALGDEGVFVVLSYHSLEDRTVKTNFREWSRTCVCPPAFPECRCRGRALGEELTRRVVTSSDDEIEINPRARSARLRAWRKAA